MAGHVYDAEGHVVDEDMALLQRELASGGLNEDEKTAIRAKLAELQKYT